MACQFDQAHDFLLESDLIRFLALEAKWRAANLRRLSWLTAGLPERQRELLGILPAGI